MASTSSYYGLQKLTGESLATNDYAFTSGNIDVIDRVLNKVESAIFTGASPIDDPTVGPSLVASTTGGQIPSGRTVRYKFTWVDATGAESAASQESVITTPSAVSAPGAPTVTYSSTGGTLLPGNYFYVISAYVDVNTSETQAGSYGYTVIPIGTTTNSITLTLPSLPSGATGFNIFRRGPGETQFSYLNSVDMSVATPPSTYSDTGAVSLNCSRQPSASNLTSSSNSITVTVPGATPTVPDGYTWKLYRTYEASNYNSSLLAWVLQETSVGSGIITPYYIDTGLGTTTGAPPTTSQIRGDTNRITDLEADVAEIQTQLGATPQGSFINVKARFEDIEDRVDVLEAATPVSGITWGIPTESIDETLWDYPGFYAETSATPFDGGWKAYDLTSTYIAEHLGVGPMENNYSSETYTDTSGDIHWIKDTYMQSAATPAFWAEAYTQARVLDESEALADMYLAGRAQNDTHDHEIWAEARSAYARLRINGNVSQTEPLLDFQTNGVHRAGVYANSNMVGFTQLINDQVGTSYTLTFEDHSAIVTFTNGSAITVTVPTDALEGIPNGARIDIIQKGAGQVGIQGDTGVTVSCTSTDTLFLRAQYSVASLIKLGVNQWLLVGDLDPA